MKSVLRAFRADKDCKIAILQYQRAEFRVGTEEHLHWSILLLFDGKVSLVRTRKCLGGVYIGTVKESQIASMREVVSNNSPKAKSAEWNCRDWVMEIIQLFAEKGWVRASIPDQATLLPSLRLASVATMAAYAQGTGAVPLVVELSG
ncbi:hypothetical protein IEO21_07789 [Rhodonia placenta]|uniref:Uncharacterized protein n=1 Tax=Rhodonia placenta TaxID=104341 RepID=A0A8H7NXH4_9APHY|nr:hypothetical protein IEO21_07789 [Postia placenta]